jgi:hypothetical protein
MDIPATNFLYALGAISTTFVGFSAIIMIFRQTAGGGTEPPPKIGFTAPHWPFQSGYFASSAARAPPRVNISATASADTPVELRYDMIVFPRCRTARVIELDRLLGIANSKVARPKGFELSV